MEETVINKEINDAIREKELLLKGTRDMTKEFVINIIIAVVSIGMLIAATVIAFSKLAENISIK